MAIDPVDLREVAEAKRAENFRFRDFLKHHTQLRSKEIDQLVFAISAKVWKDIDCTTCGNCCRTVSPLFEEADIGRLARHLGMAHPEFISKYLKPAEGEDSSWVLRESPCLFLEGTRCGVHEARPATCRGYPYLDKPEFTSRTLSMIGRLPECPAAFEVWEQLKRATGFRRHRR